MTIFLVKQLVVFIYIWQNKCVYQNDKERIFESCRRIKIMSSDYIMTMQQAQMEMELYKKVFTVVRLLDKREFRLEENDNPGGDMELCHCFDF